MTHRILTITLLLLTFAFPATAQEQTDKNQGYTLIETMPNVGEAGEKVTFTKYLTGVYTFAIAFVVIAALLMITIGGFYYITSAGNQAQAGTAKKIITDALIGLVVVFVTWLVLFTINPDLLNTTPDLGSVQVADPGLTVNQVTGGDYAGGRGAPIKPKPMTSVIDPATGKEYDTNGECLDANGQQNLCVSKQEYLKDDKFYIVTEDENGRKVYKEVSEGDGSLLRCTKEDCETGANLKLKEMYGTKSVAEAEKQLGDVGIVPADANRRAGLSNYAGATIDAATDVAKSVCGAGGCNGMEVTSQRDAFGGKAHSITLSHDDVEMDKSFYKGLSGQAAQTEWKTTNDNPQEGNIYSITETYVYPKDHPLAGQIVTVKTTKKHEGGKSSTTDIEFYVFGNKTSEIPENRGTPRGHNYWVDDYTAAP